ncbi:MAG: biotin--[acetyl-CoA-carboxylase] ligase [Proteobacteria bacterium]|nr:biotin--[acetyl-CoA-carboxylase] ligase [Pseudomonadota bacterium]MBU1059709.1 biotin--[acetyl-CoA-carboxylase] ligase [Pseudomonadota bacterium]
MDQKIYLRSTKSTNADAYALAIRGAAHGVGVLAQEQSHGRGRLGREWISPPGTGLYCSIIIRPSLPCGEFPRITLTAGLALCSAIESLTSRPFGLKWPNDLYCAGKKCGGILVESSPLHQGAENLFVIVGIGVNVNTRGNAFPLSLAGKASSLFMETGLPWDIDMLYDTIHASLLHHIALHEKQGFAEILKEWRLRDVLYEKEMQWLTTEGKVIRGWGMGPDDEGQLIARDGEGGVHKILSGDVQLLKEN